MCMMVPQHRQQRGPSVSGGRGGHSAFWCWPDSFRPKEFRPVALTSLLRKGLWWLVSGGQQEGLRPCARCWIQNAEGMDPAPKELAVGWDSAVWPRLAWGKPRGTGAAKGVVLRHWRPGLLKGQPRVWPGWPMVVSFIDAGLPQT